MEEKELTQEEITEKKRKENRGKLSDLLFDGMVKMSVYHEMFSAMHRLPDDYQFEDPYSFIVGMETIFKETKALFGEALELY